ncbi:MAG TPA: hypothetical protein VFL30_07695 [Rhodanobacteraceae bacterium]|nr:hypothetical protein [Rhodanobacteraceae bacterium]
MTSRRDLLRGAAALPLAAPFGRKLLPAFAALPPSMAVARALAAAGESLALERFVFDVRFAESGALAEHLGRLGVPLSPIADDLMTLWYDDLDLKWRKAPMGLAGVTLEDALFVLETFALDRGMHVVYRGQHGLVEDGRITHRLAGPAALLELLEPLPVQWEGALAKALTECPLGAPPTARAELVSPGGTLSLRDMPLYSWIIAPRTAVATRVES